MRKRGRTDGNQGAIVDALRKVGCSVQSLSSIGSGCPDLLVGRQGWNYLLEVKDGTAPLSQQPLTPEEYEWHFSWNGGVLIVRSVEDALTAVGA